MPNLTDARNCRDYLTQDHEDPRRSLTFRELTADSPDLLQGCLLLAVSGEWPWDLAERNMFFLAICECSISDRDLRLELVRLHRAVTNGGVTAPFVSALEVADWIWREVPGASDSAWDTELTYTKALLRFGGAVPRCEILYAFSSVQRRLSDNLHDADSDEKESFFRQKEIHVRELERMWLA